MQRAAPQFGPLMTRLMTWAQMRGVERATTGEMAMALRLGEAQCRELVDRMNRRGMVVQLQRGLYLLPSKLPPGGKWTPAPGVILRHLFEAKSGDWQECGAGAFHFHGLSDQVANTTTVYNTLFSGRDRIGGLAFVMIKVRPERLGSVVEGGGRRVGSVGRVVMDAVYDPARFGTLPQAYRWIRQRKNDGAFLDQLAECAVRYGDGGTCRRIGGALELLGMGGGVLKALRKGAGSFRSFIPLVPGGNRQGPTMKDWGLIQNEMGWMHE